MNVCYDALAQHLFRSTRLCASDPNLASPQVRTIMTTSEIRPSLLFDASLMVCTVCQRMALM